MLCEFMRGAKEREKLMKNSNREMIHRKIIIQKHFHSDVWFLRKNLQSMKNFLGWNKKKLTQT
jgi:hypothetical protein